MIVQLLFVVLSWNSTISIGIFLSFIYWPPVTYLTNKAMNRQKMHLMQKLRLNVQPIRRMVDLTETPQWKLLAGAKIPTMTQ